MELEVCSIRQMRGEEEGIGMTARRMVTPVLRYKEGSSWRSEPSRTEQTSPPLCGNCSAGNLIICERFCIFRVPYCWEDTI